MKDSMIFKMSVRIYQDENKVFGPGIAQLLHRVRELRSLRAAASSMNMAYSKAWTVLRTAENALGYKLLYSSAGGKNGGGAVLTPQGEKLLEQYDEFCRRMLRALGRPIVSTSANISGEATPVGLQDVAREIIDGVDFVVNPRFEGKPTRKASSIIAFGEGGEVKIIRE